jgi:type IV pilus assembly protein PilM
MYELNYEMKMDENVALVNIGASMININILKGGISVFTRDSAVGSNLHTEALQKEFTISYANAEKLKQEGQMEGISQEDMKAVLVSASEDIIAEISRSFDYFRDTTNYENINEIILCGGGALTTGFMPLLTDRFGVNTTMAESLKNIIVPDSFDKDYLKKVEPIISVAVGLALRRLGDK